MALFAFGLILSKAGSWRSTMNESKVKQNAERAYLYLKDLGCNKTDIDRIASELIFYNEEKKDEMPV